MNEEMPPVVEPIEQMLQQLSVNSVFGQPTKENGITVIPVAQIGLGFGYGHGYGRGPDGATEEREPSAGTGEGGGAGGGGGGGAAPRGYIKITSEGVSFEPIIDQTRISLAGIFLVAWSVFWLSATLRAVTKTLAKKRK